ncbi:hypothetical protein M407DRAFT_29993 [Tulasnella calospora MUT 4182]|uniref:Protein kinase domain-containing protein n=1 Tax=Tulasnella calospora MUT 4182 TaxID=1051891 RepID=A0A0C3Q840_9AGAM|nr:hypothetical protein M407DRAFT_29993 [Tulasnella calospora MUT 4182]
MRDAEQSITIKNDEETKTIVVKLTAIPGKNFLYRLAPDIGYLKPNEELVVKITRDRLITGTFEGEWRDVLGVEAMETPYWYNAQSQEELATKDLKEQWRAMTKDCRHIESFLVPIYHKEPETPEIIDDPEDPKDCLLFPNWGDLEKPGNWFRFHLSGKEETEAHFSAAFWEPLVGGQPQECVVRLRNSEELHPGSMTVRWVMGYKSGAHLLDFSPRSAIARALHEVRIWRELKHENIAPLYGTILWPMMGLMSPSYRNGTVLPFVVDKKPPWELRVSLMKGIASALAYMHSKCIIHGDLTETNVAIDHNYRPILNNFELSTTEQDAKEGPLPWANYRYLAPEVPWSGWRKTTRGDVYAYGVLILEIATGRLARRELEEAVDPTTSNDSWSDGDYFPDLPPDYYQELNRSSSNVLWGVIRKCTKYFLDRPPIENILPSLDDITGGDWVPQALTR